MLETRYTATLTVPTRAIGPFIDAIDPFADSHSVFEADLSAKTWLLYAVLKRDYAPDGLQNCLLLAAAAADIALPDLAIEPLPTVDWLQQVQADFPPVRRGRFFLHGSHYRPRPGEGNLRLIIDAGTAFGSGEHPTTQGCLHALELLAKRKRIGRALDMGCGSGILSLGIARLWPAEIVAVDIDPEAVAVTKRNARINGVAARITAGAGNGYHAPVMTRQAPFDLIASNILARPLRRMAPALSHALRPNGIAILSGLLNWQETSVLAAHRIQGLRLTQRIRIGDWTTLVMRR